MRSAFVELVLHSHLRDIPKEDWWANKRNAFCIFQSPLSFSLGSLLCVLHIHPVWLPYPLPFVLFIPTSRSRDPDNFFSWRINNGIKHPGRYQDIKTWHKPNVLILNLIFVFLISNSVYSQCSTIGLGVPILSEGTVSAKPCNDPRWGRIAGGTPMHLRNKVNYLTNSQRSCCFNVVSPFQLLILHHLRFILMITGRMKL